MNIHYKTHRIKALIGFCIFFAVNGLTAQNTGSYKYAFTTISKADRVYNQDVLEANNRYYLLSFGMMSYAPLESIPIVTVFDEDLNTIEQILLPGGENGFEPIKFFYEGGHFYVFGYILDNQQEIRLCFTKFDEDFSSCQPFVLYDLDYVSSFNVLMTKKNEFIAHLVHGNILHLLHIDNDGELLQETSSGFYGGDLGTAVETDSHYFIQFEGLTTFRFYKDSFDLNKYDDLYTPLSKPESGCDRDRYEGKMIAVGNQLILSATYEYGMCREDDPDLSPIPERNCAIVFLDEKINLDAPFNERISIKNRLKIDAWKPCVRERYGLMDYINPDSIYYVYQSVGDKEYAVRIANFSSEGEMNFNVTLDFNEDFLQYEEIHYCKALSNGGVLMSGFTDIDCYLWRSDYAKSFIYLYYPPKNVGIAETPHATSLRIFPNPTTGKITIRNEKSGMSSEIEIYDVVGRKLLSYTPLTSHSSPLIEIDISHLANGLYFLKIDGKMVKVVKQ
ncbi:MAG: T9SS type A sorting domain-containing protein [Lentimicrobiaceae bacterium]|nr:T9SS type A sorting domain-containing protein [Lentimicrobiaceae bacterium]